MTTHLEEVVSNYEDKFSDLIGAYDNAHLTYESIRNFIINYHIKYLEGEIEVIEDRIEDLIVELKNNYDEHTETRIYENKRWKNHKQQELLQAKELLK